MGGIISVSYTHLTILWTTSPAWNGCGTIPWYWKASPAWQRKSALTGYGPCLLYTSDPQAVVVNGYYSGYLGEERSVAELVAGVRHHYDNGLNNIAPFIEAHSDELPPDVLEAAREKAHAAGLPFYERPYRGDDIDPYTCLLYTSRCV